MKKKLKRKLQRSRQAQALRDSPVYSGPRSFEFWSLVNSVRGDLQEEMYA